VIGVATVRNVAAAGFAGIAIEAGRKIIPRRAEQRPQGVTLAHQQMNAPNGARRLRNLYP